MAFSFGEEPVPMNRDRDEAAGAVLGWSRPSRDRVGCSFHPFPSTSQ